MALFSLAASVGQTLTAGGHIVNHKPILDVVSATAALVGADVVVLVNTTNITTKNQLRSVLREIEARAIADASFKA